MALQVEVACFVPWRHGLIKRLCSVLMALRAGGSTRYSTGDHGRPVPLRGNTLPNQQLSCAHSYLGCTSRLAQLDILHTRQPMHSSQCTPNPLCLAFYLCLCTSVCFSFRLSHSCFMSLIHLFLFIFISDCFSALVSVSNTQVHTASSISPRLCQALSAI